MNEIFNRFNPFSFRLIFALVAGVIAAQQFPFLPPVWVIVLCFAATLLFGLSKLPYPAFFLFGLFWGLSIASFRLHDSLSPELERRDIRVEGEVLGVPDEIDEGRRFEFRPDSVLDPPWAKLPEKIRLSWYNNPHPIKAGEHWRLLIRLKRARGFLNPGGMDYELWLFTEGIRATGYVRENAENSRISGASPFSPGAWRQSVFDHLAKALAGEEMGGVAIALTMGEENAISPEQWAVLRRTGTAHLVAISGSHISLIAGLVFLGARGVCAWLGIQRWPPQALAAAAASSTAFLYSALAGFSIPTQRALIMVFVVMAGIMSQRNVRPSPTLALALLSVVLYDPLAVLSAGFWLSYGAVALILLVIAGRLRPAGWWGDLWTINWATSVGLAPLLLFFFRQVSLISPLANLIAVPTIGLVLTPLCLVGALLLGVHVPLGEFVLRLAAKILGWIWWLLQWLSDLPWAQWNHPAPPAWTLIFALAGAILLLSPRGVPARWLGAILLVPALTVSPRPPFMGNFRLTLLDVGQGLAATVQTHNHTLVFDAGPRFSKSFDTGSAVVEPFLHQTGVEKIDTLVVSHGDNDHVGGVDSLLRGFVVRKTYSSVPARLPKAIAEPCGAGQTWEWDGVRFEMLSPIETLANDNDNSCVLRVSAALGSALLTGDIEHAAEKMLVERYGEDLKTQILIAPHHGSNTSSTETFLAAVQPDYVLIPAGYLNRYSFPHPDVLRRYRDIGTKVFDSASSGAITVEPDVLTPQSYRQTNGKYWNDR